MIGMWNTASFNKLNGPLLASLSLVKCRENLEVESEVPLPPPSLKHGIVKSVLLLWREIVIRSYVNHHAQWAKGYIHWFKRKEKKPWQQGNTVERLINHTEIKNVELKSFVSFEILQASERSVCQMWSSFSGTAAIKTKDRGHGRHYT